MKVIALIVSCLLVLCFTGCSKKNDREEGPVIKNFLFTRASNPSLPQDIYGKIVNNVITISLAEGTNVSGLIPTIIHTGTTLEPDNTISCDFTQPVTYTLTDAKNRKTIYTVRVVFISGEKEITSFVIESAKNAALTADIRGQIINDTILLDLPLGLSSYSFTPTITFKGVKVLPTGAEAINFAETQFFSVMAEDGSVKGYTVLANSNINVYFGSTDGYVYALEAKTGKLVWRYKTQAEIWVTPILYSNNLYIGSNDGYLYCLNAMTGALNWKYNTNGYVLRAPMVSGGNLYLVGYSSSRGKILSLHPMTGAINWEVPINSCYSPTVVNDIVYVSSFDGIYAFNANNGTQKWFSNFTGITQSNFSIVNDTIFGSGELGFAFALKASTGEMIWREGTERAFNSSPTVSNGVIYVGARKFYALNTANGSIKWEYNSYNTNGFFTSPVLHNGVVYCGDDDGNLFALYAKDGSKYWQHGDGFYSNTRPSSGASPVVANGVVFFGGGNKGIFSAFTTGGTKLWSYQTGGVMFMSAPCVMGTNNMYYHSGDTGYIQ